jgi:hypothetical protein
LTCVSPRRRVAPGLLRITGARDGIEPDNPHGFLLNQVLRLHEQMGWISKRYKYPKVIDPEGLSRFAQKED